MRRIIILLPFLFLIPLTGCGLTDGLPLPAGPLPTEMVLSATGTATPFQSLLASATSAPEGTQALAPTATPTPFGIGRDITIDHLRKLEIEGSEINFEQELTPTFYYEQHLVSYRSEGNKIYALLTIPAGEPPEGGYKAIVFNHGYIPPIFYQTTERYKAHVNHLAQSGFVVMKIDYRGHGNSEGDPAGSYFSPGYTIDSIAALKSLQTLDFVDPEGIGMWGHSMAGNLVLRAMLIEPDIKAGVIWAGAVYSYDDFAEFGIDDNTYRPPPTEEGEDDRPRRSRQIFEVYGRPDTKSAYWKAVSLTQNIEHLTSPLQIHHAEDDAVVTIRYSEGLASVMIANDKEYEFYRYEGGGHNLLSPSFGQAMRRTVEFFREHL
ncbi:MAG: alpha/beta hydrolase family protein [Anaerolineales bacterium]